MKKESKIIPSKLHPYKEHIRKAYELGYYDSYIAREITKEMQKTDKKAHVSKELIYSYSKRQGFARKKKPLFN